MLVTQCITSLSLISEESATDIPSSPAHRDLSVNAQADVHLKDVVSSATAPNGEGLVECLIGTKDPFRPWRYTLS